MVEEIPFPKEIALEQEMGFLRASWIRSMTAWRRINLPKMEMRELVSKVVTSGDRKAYKASWKLTVSSRPISSSGVSLNSQ